MTELKECPMCAEFMRPREMATVARVPGTAETTSLRFSEWVCPECDYFEEVEGDSNRVRQD